MSMYEFVPFHLRADRLQLIVHGEPIALGPRVVKTLLVLVERAGEIVDKNELLDSVWPEGFVEEANLTQNVYVLRKILNSQGMAGAIETIPRRGYRFTAPVRRVVSASPVNPPQRRTAFGLRLATVLSCVAFVAASFVPLASSRYDFAAPDTLSQRGERFYEIGLYYWNLRTREGVQKSVAYFSQVVQTDPFSARGYAALADANITMGDYCYGTHRPAVYFARAQAYANKAIVLDANSAPAHAALGFLALQKHEVARGIAELRRAIALDPAYGTAHEWYGIVLLGRGDRSEGLRQLDIAANLDPLSVAVSTWLGSTSLRNRRYDDAIAYSLQALELAPDRDDALLTLKLARQNALRNRTHAARKHRMAFENAARSE